MWQYYFIISLAIKSQCIACRCLQFAPHKLYVMQSLNIWFESPCMLVMHLKIQTYRTPPRVWVPHISPAKDLSFEAPTRIMTNPWMILRKYSLHAASVGYTFCPEQYQLDSKETKMNFQCKFIFYLIYMLQFQHNYV